MKCRKGSAFAFGKDRSFMQESAEFSFMFVAVKNSETITEHRDLHDCFFD